MTKKREVMIIANYSGNSLLTLKELCEICSITPDFVDELVSYEIIRPKQSREHEILFEAMDLHRVKTTLRLQHDLELNLAGVALVLDLLQELEELRARMKFLEKDL